MSDYIVPSIICIVLLYGFITHSDVFSAFLKGVRSGLSTLMTIFPSALAMLIAVNMLRASGLLDMLVWLMSPVAQFLGIPSECASLALLKPISGGGALAMGTDIIQAVGVDSLAGRTAAVMLASADTTFFVMSIYFGSLKIKNTRYTLPSALLSDLTAFVAAAAAIRFFFG